MITAARSVSSDADSARTALKLGPRSIDERLRNTVLDSSPTLPAIERYTGVLYDPLDVAAADADTRAWWYEHVVVQSAMFGPIRGGDRIPAYRLSHDSRLGGVRSGAVRLGSLWPGPAAAVLGRLEGLVLDLRSEGYRALGPVAHGVPLRVVSDDGTGRRKALNHWNKTAKGRLVALLGRTAPDLADMDDLVSWARKHAVRIERVDGRWDLVAESLEPVAA